MRGVLGAAGLAHPALGGLVGLGSLDRGRHVTCLAFSADGGTISGRWETSQDGSTWEHDFDLTYRKVT